MIRRRRNVVLTADCKAEVERFAKLPGFFRRRIPRSLFAVCGARNHRVDFPTEIRETLKRYSSITLLRVLINVDDGAGVGEELAAINA